MKMNLANMLIVLRLVLIPFFLFFFLNAGQGESVYRLIAVTIYLVAAISDYFDGYLARKWNTVSNFGKLMDPLADKMLVSSALIALAYRQELSAWVVTIIICREFWVTGLRLLALEQGKVVIAASNWGKIKTVLQMTMLAAVMAGMGTAELFGEVGTMISTALIYMAVIATVVSAMEYTKNYRTVFLA